MTARFVRQLDLEKSLADFQPDYEEACELLDALIAGLGHKVGEHRLNVVNEELEALKTAIRESQPYELEDAA